MPPFPHCAPPHIFFWSPPATSGVIHPHERIFLPKSGICRRRFLAATRLALAAPVIIPASARQDGRRAPPNALSSVSSAGACKGPGNTNELFGLNDAQVVAACDLDKNHLQTALDNINGRYKNQDCQALP